jgi:hypothetical protein
MGGRKFHSTMMQTMMSMAKLDIARLQQAYDGR